MLASFLITFREALEAGIIPEGITQVWDLNPPLNPDGTYPSLGYWIIIGTFVYRTYKVGIKVKDGSGYPQD